MKKTINRHYSLGYFNTARGLGALFVIIGHSMALFLSSMSRMPALPVFAGAGRVIGSGIMAMLFMVSGFYFQRRPMKRCIRTQTRMLLKPYFSTGLAILLGVSIRLLIEGKPFLKNGLRILTTFALGTNAATGGRTLLGLNVGTVSIFWFVLALCWGWIIYNMISFIPVRWMRFAALCCCALVSRVMVGLSDLWPMALPMALMAVCYLAVGNQIRIHQLMDKKLPVWIQLPIILIALVCLAFGHVDIAACVWKLGLLDMLGSVCVGYLLLLFYAKIMDRPNGSKLFRRIDNLGIQSLKILCLHAFEKEVIPWKRLIEVFPNRPILCAVLCTVGRLLIIQGLILLLEHIRRFLRRKKRITLEITEG